MTFRETERAPLHDWTGELVGLRGRGRAEDKSQRCGPSFALVDDTCQLPPGSTAGKQLRGKPRLAADILLTSVPVRNYHDQKQPGRKGLIWCMVPKRLSPLGQEIQARSRKQRGERPALVMCLLQPGSTS